MNLKTPNLGKALLLFPLAALCIAFTSTSAQAQSNPAMAPPGGMPMHQMNKGANAPKDMKGSMMMGMDDMQKMTMTGDVDKDFAMMMKIHHQQAVNMAEMQLAKGKSPEMKTMSRQIIAAQNKEIAQFDKWLAKQK